MDKITLINALILDTLPPRSGDFYFYFWDEEKHGSPPGGGGVSSENYGLKGMIRFLYGLKAYGQRCSP